VPHPCSREAQSRFSEKEEDLRSRIDALQQEQRRLEDRSVAIAHAPYRAPLRKSVRIFSFVRAVTTNSDFDEMAGAELGIEWGLQTPERAFVLEQLAKSLLDTR